MAPLSHFAIAALAVVSVAAAPLPTQPSSRTTLERRQGGGFSDFVYDMIQYYAEEEFMKQVGEVSYKPDISNGLDSEEKLENAPPQGGQ